MKKNNGGLKFRDTVPFRLSVRAVQVPGSGEDDSQRAAGHLQEDPHRTEPGPVLQQTHREAGYRRQEVMCFV
jgi:hypothetical protein